ncbi:macro domain-containing protein [Allobaculum stercoricanis]|uniref:macro domain-containing protein n=1 Tax=Allobaculum stercoricanis TaxID=174709 RepID=UPI00248D6DDF|nr:macro domain-containing protein [Allobaculum stercoricanis]
MPFEIVCKDLNDLQVDAVVRVVDADSEFDLGAEQDGHIKVEFELFESKDQNGCSLFDDVVIVPICNQEAKYVIYIKRSILLDDHDDDQILASCYRKVLEVADAFHCESIALPLLDLKRDGWTKDLALQVALQEIRTFLFDHEMQVYLVVSKKEDFMLSQNLYESVLRYIDENYDSKIIDDVVDSESVDGAFFRLRKIESIRNERIRKNEIYVEKGGTFGLPTELDAPAEYLELGELLQDLDAGFSETLLKLIDRTGKKDSEIYKKANVDRKLFSKIRNHLDYQPSKRTALAFAFALELDLEETEDFIGRAGYRLSHSNKFDVIIEYFLVNKNYDVFELNEVLFAFDQPLIGA